MEDNVVFTYLDAFNPDEAETENMKAHYRRGGLGDSKIKARLEDVLQNLIAPIRARRAAYANDPGYVVDVIRQGTVSAREVTERTKREVFEGLGLFTL
ncbi:tryptophanyl-tRNA synthetase [Roseobacter sp. GAI101]|nr:tryptophanyl-tRNA synthetase [Roseobacter sp. GAI101]